MPCYPFCKWDDLDTYMFGNGGQPTTIKCRVCSDVYSADTTAIDPLTMGEHVEKLAKLAFSAVYKIRELEKELDGHVYPGPPISHEEQHFDPYEMRAIRQIMAEWHSFKSEETRRKEEREAEKSSQSQKRSNQAFWTIPNPDRTDGKW